MAISTPTFVAQNGGLSFGGTTFDVASQSYTAGDLLLLGWWVTGISGAPSMSVATAPSGGDATSWGAAITSEIASDTHLGAAICVIPTTGSYTFRVTTGSTNGHCMYTLCKIASGYNASTPEVSANRVTTATYNPSTPDRANTDNMRISWFSAKASGAPTCTGLTKIAAADRNLFDNSISFAHGITDTDVVWQDIPPQASINIEIAVAGAAATSATPWWMRNQYNHMLVR